jgi:uncharacterized protein YxjI
MVGRRRQQRREERDTFGLGGDKIAEVSKRWFRVRDTYGIEVAPGQHDIVVLAVAVAVDAMAGGRQ